MVKKIVVALLSFFILKGLAAQPAPTVLKWRFHSINQLGLLQGESRPAFQLQTVNGFQHGNLFVGLGTGLDYYTFKSIPLFADLRRYFGKSKTRFFVYADAGLHFVWEDENQTVYYTEKYDPGFYGNGGIGLRTGSGNSGGFLLSAGYSYKRVNKRQEQTICGIMGPCFIKTDVYNYDLNRLIIQIGWMF